MPSIDKNLIDVSIVFGIVTIGYFAYGNFRRLFHPSKYILVATKLGLSGYTTEDGRTVSIEHHQEALLKVFQMAGYFELPSIWRDLNNLGSIDHVEKLFEEISNVIKMSNANQTDPNLFDAEYMRKHLFQSDTIDLQDVLDLLLYIAQHAFSRDIGQERYEITLPNWMQTHKDDYFKEVQLLRLIDRHYPLLTSYDGAWIAGAARISLLHRIINFNYYVNSTNIKINGEIVVLTGERELWANIDGISPAINKILLEISKNNHDIDTVVFPSSTNNEFERIDEGKAYMMHLAEFYNIKLNLLEPFIEYKNKDECPPIRYPNRVYANYDSNETTKLTETLMSNNLLRTYFNNRNNHIHVVNALSENETRLNTASTARDASERLIKSIMSEEYGDKKNFIILFCSSNPYIERKTLIVQEQVDQTLRDYNLIEKGFTIRIEGVGCSSKSSLVIVHSELAALITEKWKAIVADMEKPKRDIKDLLFQTRNKN